MSRKSAFDLMKDYSSLVDPEEAANKARAEAQSKMDYLLFEIECQLIYIENDSHETFRHARQDEMDDITISVLERLRDNLTSKGVTLLPRWARALPPRVTP